MVSILDPEDSMISISVFRVWYPPSLTWALMRINELNNSFGNGCHSIMTCKGTDFYRFHIECAIQGAIRPEIDTAVKAAEASFKILKRKEI